MVVSVEVSEENQEAGVRELRHWYEEEEEEVLRTRDRRLRRHPMARARSLERR